MTIEKGDIFLCDLDPVIGYEQGGKRPVLVVQNSTMNDPLHTIMIAPLTSNLKASRFLLTALIKADSDSNLSQDSVALLFQIRAVDKRRLKQKIGKISSETLAKVNSAIALAFDLPGGEIQKGK